MAKVWQLKAEGDSVNGWAFKMYSRQVYARRDDAVAATPAFVDRCCDTEKYFEAAKRDTLVVRLIPLDFVAEGGGHDSKQREGSVGEKRKGAPGHRDGPLWPTKG